jgi:hypothetical protein
MNEEGKWMPAHSNRVTVKPMGLVVFSLMLLGAAYPSIAAEGPAAVTVDGSGFAIERFENDAVAYGNRGYVWKEVPEQFGGWQFTQTCGGVRATIEVVPEEDGVLYAATRRKGIDLSVWEEVEGTTFHYTDGGYSAMVVFQRACRAGERVVLPQWNWSGAIIIAPALRMGKVIEPVYEPVPGVVVDTSPDPMKVYIGSPSIAVLPNGNYVASHDFFGPGTPTRMSGVFGSEDMGATWRKLAELDGQWWSTLFVHRGDLYIIGTDERYGNAAIRRSSDGGRTWTTPADGETGLLLGDGKYHCAPMPVVVHKGRIWRTMEDSRGPGGWGSHFRAFVMSAPVDSDLLRAANWTFSNRLEFDPAWFEAKNPGWLEGNVVVTPEGGLVNILRFNDDRGDRAAIVRISEDGKTVSFDPATGFIDFPGGRTKFTIRFDPKTKRYWSLVNRQLNPDAFRNVLALTSSAGLADWDVESIILQHPDKGGHAFQYVDWLFDGDDIIAVSRTAWDGAHNAHDANYMTFHRVADFRRLKEGGEASRSN